MSAPRPAATFINPRVLKLLLILASEPHATASAAEALGASCTSIVRWFGAVVASDRAHT